ncbi:hypothetical protein [Actinoalloteichus caeruleus]|uniref:hypothetical protein n=1 Tax=Actinoalloteichus cyanogriseus TaxID=2893586 RepID=UPI003AB03869
MTAFVVTLVAALLLVAGLALDGGLALATNVRATGQAQAAARAGAQALDLTAYREQGHVRLDAARAVAQAQAYLREIDATGTVTASAERVEVAVHATHQARMLSLVGIGEIPVRGQGSAEPVSDVSAPGP